MSGPRREMLHAGWRYLKNIFLIFLVGYVFIVYPVYFLFTANYPIAKQASDTTSILTSFASGPTPAGEMCHGLRCLADVNIWMAGNLVFRPIAQYMLGILMVLQRADGGNTIYFLGHVVSSGGWIYFPLLYLVKEPLPTLIIVVMALILALCLDVENGPRGALAHLASYPRLISVNFAEFTMGSFIVLYWGYSMHSPLNIGIRHIIPTLPFIYILAAGVWKKWIVRFDLPASHIGIRDPATMVSRSWARSRNIASSLSCSPGYFAKPFSRLLIFFRTSMNSAAARERLSLRNGFELRLGTGPAAPAGMGQRASGSR